MLHRLIQFVFAVVLTCFPLLAHAQSSEEQLSINDQLTLTEAEIQKRIALSGQSRFDITVTSPAPSLWRVQPMLRELFPASTAGVQTARYLSDWVPPLAVVPHGIKITEGLRFGTSRPRHWVLQEIEPREPSIGFFLTPDW